MQTHINGKHEPLGWAVGALCACMLALLIIMVSGTNANRAFYRPIVTVFRPFKVVKRLFNCRLKKKRKVPKLDVTKQITISSETSQLSSATSGLKSKPLSRSPTNPLRVSKQSVTQQGDARNSTNTRKTVKEAPAVKTHAPIGLKMKPRCPRPDESNAVISEDSTAVKEDNITEKEEVTSVNEENPTPKVELRTVKEDIATVKEKNTTAKGKVTPVKEKNTTAKEKAAPVKEKVTPVKEEIAAVKEKITPAKENIAVKEKVSSLKEKVTPVKDEITPVKEKVTPVKENVTPAKEEIAPVKDKEQPKSSQPETAATLLQKKPKRHTEIKPVSSSLSTMNCCAEHDFFQSTKADISSSDNLSTVTGQTPVTRTRPPTPSKPGCTYSINIDAQGSKMTQKEPSTEKEIPNLNHNALHSNVPPSHVNVNDVLHPKEKTLSTSAPAKAEVSLPLAAATSACLKWSTALSTATPCTEKDLVLSPDVMVPDATPCSGAYSPDAAVAHVAEVSSNGILPLHLVVPIAPCTRPNDECTAVVEESQFDVLPGLNNLVSGVLAPEEKGLGQHDADQSYFLPSLGFGSPVPVRTDLAASPKSARRPASVSSDQGGNAAKRPSHENLTRLELESALFPQGSLFSSVEDLPNMDWEVSGGTTWVSLEGTPSGDDAFAMRTSVDAVTCHTLNESWIPPDVLAHQPLNEAWIPTDRFGLQQLDKRWSSSDALACQQLNESWTLSNALACQQLNRSWAPTDALMCQQMNDSWTPVMDALVRQQVNESWTQTDALVCQNLNDGSIPTNALEYQQLNERWALTDSSVRHEVQEGSIPTNTAEYQQVNESWTLTDAVHQKVDASSKSAEILQPQERNETCRKDDVDSAPDDDDASFATRDALIDLYKTSLREFFEGADCPKERASTRSKTLKSGCFIPANTTQEHPESMPSTPRLRKGAGSTISLKDEDGEQKPKKDQRQPTWSIGAEKHFEGKCQPCGFYYKKDCRNASFCVYCHMCPRTELKRRKKDKVAGLRRGEAASNEKTARKRPSTVGRRDRSDTSTFSSDVHILPAWDAARDNEQSPNIPAEM